MTAPHIVDPAWFAARSTGRGQPGSDADLLQSIINALLSADADACGRRVRPPQHRAGTSATGTGTATWTPGSAPSTSRSPSCARALLPGVAAGAAQAGRGRADHRGGGLLPAGVSTRRMDKLVKTLGIDSACRSPGLRMAKPTSTSRSRRSGHRPLGAAGPFTFVAADALTMKVREGGRVSTRRAGRHRRQRRRAPRGPRPAVRHSPNRCGVERVLRRPGRPRPGRGRLVTSDAHAGLVEAIARTCPARPGNGAAPTTPRT
jgi:putative transposase